MPFPNGDGPGGFMMEVITEGMSTPTVMKIAAITMLAGTAGALTKMPHFITAMTPGHFNKLDKKCIEILKLTPEEVEHINEWPDVQKERVRQELVKAIAAERPMVLKWVMRRWRRKERTDIEVSDEATVVTFNQVARHRVA